MDIKPPYKIVVTTSDKYLPALRPYLWLLEKYWRPLPDVVIAGYSLPEFVLPEYCTFVSIGKFEDYPVSKWTDGLLKFFNNWFKDEVFVLMLEDYWITRQVDTRAVQILYDYMHQFKYVIKTDLCADRLYAHGADTEYGHVAYLDLVKSMPGSPYHMSLLTGLWRREHLVKHLQPGWTPWDVELIGTTHLSHDQDLVVLGTRQWPIRHCLAFRSGDSGKLDLSRVDPADVEAMTQLGLLAPWGVE